jgi:hypothetical protein
MPRRKLKKLILHLLKRRKISRRKNRREQKISQRRARKAAKPKVQQSQRRTVQLKSLSWRKKKRRKRKNKKQKSFLNQFQKSSLFGRLSIWRRPKSDSIQTIFLTWTVLIVCSNSFLVFHNSNFHLNSIQAYMRKKTL